MYVCSVGIVYPIVLFQFFYPNVSIVELVFKELFIITTLILNRS